MCASLGRQTRGLSPKASLTMPRPWAPLTTECPEADTPNEYLTQVGGYLSKPLAEKDAWCLHGRGISQKSGRRSGMLTFAFQFILDRAKASLELLYHCACSTVFMEYPETGGSEGCRTMSTLWALEPKFPH